MACIYAKSSLALNNHIMFVVQATSKPKKQSKLANYVSVPSNSVCFLFDVETTGGKRNYDKIISLSFLAYSVDGSLLGSFDRLINPGTVTINSYLSNNVHSKFI